MHVPACSFEIIRCSNKRDQLSPSFFVSLYGTCRVQVMPHMKELTDLLQLMSSADPQDRITPESVRGHYYFDKQVGVFGSAVPLQP